MALTLRRMKRMSVGRIHNTEERVNKQRAKINLRNWWKRCVDAGDFGLDDDHTEGEDYEGSLPYPYAIQLRTLYKLFCSHYPEHKPLKRSEFNSAVYNMLDRYASYNIRMPMRQHDGEVMYYVNRAMVVLPARKKDTDVGRE